MHVPKKPASSVTAAPRKLTDFERFGLPEPPPTVIDYAPSDRPDWYDEWLGEDQLLGDFTVWSDAQQAVEIFGLCQTQWRVGKNGITGLDYAAVIAVIALYCPYPPDQRDVLNDIHALEIGALTAFNEQRERAEAKAKGSNK